MAIGNVPLNVDPRGYAGQVTQGLQTPQVYQPGGSPIYSLLAQQASMKNRLAQKQLALMQEQLNDARLNKRHKQAALASRPEMRRPGKRGRNVDKTHLAAKGFFDTMGGHRKPGDTRALSDWLSFIGPRAAHAGLMQSGRLLGSRSAPGKYGGAMPIVAAPVGMRGGIGGGGLGLSAAQGVPGISSRPSALVQARQQHGSPQGTMQGVINAAGGEKGGKVPKTGKYKLHEGEVVLSADQVDDPLMEALMGDKLNKMRTGQMDGKGTGPGRTLGSYQTGTVKDPSVVMPRIAGKGNPAAEAIIEAEWQKHVQRVKDELGDQAHTVLSKEQLAGETLKQGSRRAEKLREATRKAATGKGGGIVGGVTALLEPWFGAIQDSPEGADILRSMGVNIPQKGYQEGTLGFLASLLGRDEDIIKAALGDDVIDATPEPEDTDTRAFNPIEIARRFGSELSDLDVSRFTPSGGFEGFREFFGGEQPDLESSLRAANLPEPEPIPTEAPGMVDLGGVLGEHQGVQAERDLEIALQRVRGGDMGSAVNPLTLRGDPNAPLKNTLPGTDPYTGQDPNLAPEDQYFNPASPAWRKAEHRRSMAASNRSKGERIADYLSANSGDMDPKQVAALDSQSKMHFKLADDYEKREETKKTKLQEMLMVTQEILGSIEQERIKADAGIEREDIKGQYRMQQKMEDNFNSLEKLLLKPDMEEEDLDRVVMAMAQLLNEETDEGVESAVERIRTKYGL